MNDWIDPGDSKPEFCEDVEAVLTNGEIVTAFIDLYYSEEFGPVYDWSWENRDPKESVVGWRQFSSKEF